MYGRTNKLWKGLALTVAFCMGSTFVRATETTNIVTMERTEYDQMTATATISGYTSPAEIDVTIIALRDADPIPMETFYSYTAETLQEKVVYIDQESSDETGAYSFSFIPRTGVHGGTITAFVGGENVAEAQSVSFTAKIAAPFLVPEVWYEGDDVLNIALTRYDGTPYNSAAAQAWYDQINVVKVNGAVIDNARLGIDYENAVLRISGFGLTGSSVTGIEITTVYNDYTDAVWTGEAAQVKKTPGTLTAPAVPVIAGTAAEIKVTDADAPWSAALADSVYVDGAKAENITYTAPILSVPTTLDAETLEKDVTVSILQTYYRNVTATFKVTAPTKADADMLAPSVEYSTTEFETGDAAYVESEFNQRTEKDRQAMFGKAFITLPGTGANGSVITWKINGEQVAADTAIALTRPDSAAEDGEIEVTAEAAKPGYKTAVKTWKLPVYKIASAARLTAADVEVGDTVRLTAKLRFSDVYNGTLAAASYTDGNKLAGVRLYAAAETVTVELPVSDVKYLKLMWLDMETLTPYSDSLPINIQTGKAEETE